MSVFCSVSVSSGCDTGTFYYTLLCSVETLAHVLMLAKRAFFQALVLARWPKRHVFYTMSPHSKRSSQKNSRNTQTWQHAGFDQFPDLGSLALLVRLSTIMVHIMCPWQSTPPATTHGSVYGNTASCPSQVNSNLQGMSMAKNPALQAGVRFLNNTSRSGEKRPARTLPSDPWWARKIAQHAHDACAAWQTAS